MRKKILIIEDDQNLRETLCDLLELEDFKASQAKNITTAKEFMRNNPIDLVVLDLMLPDGSGYELSQWIRQEYPETMILMLTARVMENDIVSGFESGADDYVTKPYRSQELLMRINALLRRGQNQLQTNTSIINGIKIDWLAIQITKNEEIIHLTNKAFQILQLLYKNVGQVLSREIILNKVWGKDVYIDNRTIDNFISVIKNKLNLNQPENYYIKSVRGVGYCLIKSNEDS